MNKWLKDIHWPIVILSAAMTLSSLLFIYSATFRGGENFVFRQFMWLGLSLCVLGFVVRVGYRFFLNISYLLYGFSLALLFMVLMHGSVRQGAQRWFAVSGLVLQPSEICKVATILALAHFLSSRPSWTAQKRTLLTAFLMAGLPVLLILKQPDLGTALVFVAVSVAVLFVWGLRLRYFTGLFTLAAIASPILWMILKPYQKRRLLTFLNPNADPLGAGYTAIQSKIAVGSGGLIGKGWLHGTQTQLDFVPEHHTDFIFSVVGEEFGFLGSLLLVLVYGVLIGYMIRIMDRTTDPRARLLACGVVMMIFFQAFVNLGMTIGLMPITGITLPFLSYGGSSMVASFLAIGFMVSIHKERSIF